MTTLYQCINTKCESKKTKCESNVQVESVDDIYRIISNNPPASHSKGFQVTVLRPLTNEWTVSAPKDACVFVYAVWCCRYV